MALTLRSSVLTSLSLAAGLASSCLAADQSINNTVKITVAKTLPASAKWDLKVLKGAGKAGEQLELKSATAVVKLNPGEHQALEVGKSYDATFAPNSGNDGSSYQVRFTDGKGHTVDYKVEKAVNTALALKTFRKLVWTRTGQSLSPAFSQQMERGQEESLDAHVIVIKAGEVKIDRAELP